MVIIDVTGVPEVDEGATGALQICAGGLRLLGARCIITGLRAGVAGMLAELAADLRAEFHSTLERGLHAARLKTRAPITESRAAGAG